MGQQENINRGPQLFPRIKMEWLPQASSKPRPVNGMKEPLLTLFFPFTLFSSLVPPYQPSLIQTLSPPVTCPNHLSLSFDQNSFTFPPETPATLPRLNNHSVSFFSTLRSSHLSSLTFYQKGYCFPSIMLCWFKTTYIAYYRDSGAWPTFCYLQ